MVVAILVLSVFPQWVRPPVDAHALSRDNKLPHELMFLVELDPEPQMSSWKSGLIVTGMSVSGECQTIDERKVYDKLAFSIAGESGALLERVKFALANSEEWRMTSYKGEAGKATFFHKTKSNTVYFDEHRPGQAGRTSVIVTSIRGT